MRIKYCFLVFLVTVTIQLEADSIPVVPPAFGLAGTGPDGFGFNESSGTLGGSTLIESSSYSGGSGSASASTNIVGDPTVTGNSNGTATGYAQLTYYFEVMGAPGTNVLVDVSGALSATSNVPGSGNNEAQASILIDSAGTGQTFLSLGACNIACVGPSWTFVGGGAAFNDAILIPSDVVITVEMAALAESNEADTSDSFNASVDPFIQIDPTFLADNPGYSLVLSSDIVNAPLSGVPEPKTSGLLLAGLLGVAFMAKRNRAKSI